MSPMRTTLDIEDDVLHAAKERARSEGTSAGQVISAWARASLLAASGATRTQHDAKAAAASKRLARLGIQVLPRRGAVVTDALVNRLREEEGV
jgi:hypothetical protein